MATEDQESGRGFRVQDRRRFSPETGEPRVEEVEKTSSEETRHEAPTAETEAKFQKTQTPLGGQEADEPISFSSFILGLITQALLFMGEAPSPEGQQQVDLSAARQMIDLLAMLKQKTKGNLDPAEDTILENALFDLRMRYVQIAKK